MHFGGANATAEVDDTRRDVKVDSFMVDLIHKKLLKLSVGLQYRNEGWC